MEEELQMPSCLFGGPPVQDDMIKLGESQIGFMNIFARPLFEAVTDILPAMRFAVDEILINKGIWETRIDQEKQRRKNKAPMHLSLLNASFAPDPTPSPFSGGPNRPPNASVPAPTTVPEETGRRGSNGSVSAAMQNSRRSSAAMALASRENQSTSRRGSGDANLTAILVTHTPNASDGTPRGSDAGLEGSKADRKDTLTRSSSKKKDRDNGRPVTAPAPARRSQGKHRSTFLDADVSVLTVTQSSNSIRSSSHRHKVIQR